MKERPILFSSEMVKSILEGRKTQTRRIVKPQPVNLAGPNFDGLWSDTQDPVARYFACPYGRAGDRLWVKETHAFYSLDYLGYGTWHPIDRDVCCHYRQGCPLKLEDRIDKWRPSIFMPRWASRITLEIESVRVERLQSISEVDAKAEGIKELTSGLWRSYHHPAGFTASAITSYETLWESINGKGSWAINPWCWCISFRALPPKEEEK